MPLVIYNSHIANITIIAVKILLLSYISRNSTQCHLSGIKIGFEFWMCRFKALTEHEDRKERFC